MNNPNVDKEQAGGYPSDLEGDHLTCVWKPLVSTTPTLLLWALPRLYRALLPPVTFAPAANSTVKMEIRVGRGGALCVWR